MFHRGSCLEIQRAGQTENVIKELKIGFSAEYMPFNDFGSNAFWFALQVLAYNVFVMKKEMVLPESYKTKTIGSIRWLFIEVAGKIVNKARQIELKISATLDKLFEYLAIKWRLEDLRAFV